MALGFECDGCPEAIKNGRVVCYGLKKGVVFRRVYIVDPITISLYWAFGLLYKKELVIGFTRPIDKTTPMVGIISLYGF